MADYSKLINDIKAVIKENGENSITGKVLQDVLVDMVGCYPEPPAPVDVIDSLDSTSSTAALSAKQGNVLNQLISAIPNVPNVVDSLNSTSSTDALSAKQGNVLYQMISSGTGMNYMKITSSAYEAAYEAGTLSSNILYIIVG